MNKSTSEIYKSAADIRRLFIDYFTQKDHTHVPSASLVPAGDPTLLFTNSGMVPFKDVFLGKEQRPYKRAVTAQRCVRAGGKHNDLENVGYTARHHTFFEMMGNFSFGDYFKREAISFAWEFVTEKIGLAPDKIWITVHHTDDEAAKIWHKDIGIPEKRIIALDEDNFWQMGDTGPCGPCSEIFYDHGPSVEGDLPGGPNEGDRYIEIWNLVFMQFNRDIDGNMNPLPRPSVDTGMGLERMAAVLQGVHNNYDTDLFAPLLNLTSELCRSKPDIASQRIIADHIRSSAFLIADGVNPANEGRGYVLRRIIRRALRHGNKLNIESPFFYKLVAPLVAEMSEAHPLIGEKQNEVVAVLRDEEDKFNQTLEKGLALLRKQTAKISGGVSGGILDGATTFKLYDTYGFPPDLTEDIGREQGFKVDWDGFNQCMEEQKKRSRAYSMFHKQDYSLPKDIASTNFTGYDDESTEARIMCLLNEGGKSVAKLQQGEEGLVVLDKSPFYAESGGQIGDKGRIVNEGGIFVVEDTQKQDGVFLHFGHMEEGIFQTGGDKDAAAREGAKGITKGAAEGATKQATKGEIKGGTKVTAQIDASRRAQIKCHHTAAHLLHAALHEVLGKDAQQRGSRVANNYLRLDFAHNHAMSDEELTQVEDLVNTNIRAAKNVVISEQSLQQAKQEGAMALFGEKYGDVVRVVDIPGASKELCGGTHVENCRDIEEFIIRNESSIATGIRRIEALATESARQSQRNERKALSKIKSIVSVKDESQLPGKILDLVERLDKSEKEVQRLTAAKQLEDALDKVNDELADIPKPGGVPLLLLTVDEVHPSVLNQLADRILVKIKRGVLVLANRQSSSNEESKQGKVGLLITSSKDVADKCPANELMRHIISQLEGSGGGNAVRAQGGGVDLPELAQVLNSAAKWIEERAN